MARVSMADQRVVSMAEEMEEIWLNPEGNKGWHTCLTTGKKMRGSDAKERLSEQEDILEQIIERIDQEDKEADQQSVEGKYDKMPELLADDGPEMPDNLRQYIRSHKNVKTKAVECVDCGKERLIKVQDAFQVTRCVSCQKKRRNRKRAERRKNNKERAEG